MLGFSVQGTLISERSQCSLFTTSIRVRITLNMLVILISLRLPMSYLDWAKTLSDPYMMMNEMQRRLD